MQTNKQPEKCPKKRPLNETPRSRRRARKPIPARNAQFSIFILAKHKTSDYNLKNVGKVPLFTEIPEKGVWLSAQQDLSYIFVESRREGGHWWHCRDCGNNTYFILPTELNLYAQQIKDYTKKHSECSQWPVKVVESNPNREPYWFHCYHCANHTFPDLPTELNLYIQQMENYIQAHSECQSPLQPVKDL